MSWLFFAVTVISIFLEAIIAATYFSALSIGKYFKRNYNLLFYILFMVIRSSAYFFAEDVFTNIAVTLVTTVLLSLLYKFTKLKQVFAILTLCIAGILVEYAVGFFLSFILNITVGEVINSVLLYTVGMLVSKLFLFGGVKYFAAKYKSKNTAVINKFFGMFIIFPIVTFFVGVVLIGGIGINLDDDITLIGTTAMILLVCANVFVFFLFDIYAKQLHSQFESDKHIIQLLREKEFLNEVIEKQTQGNKKMHDLKNQLFAIRQVLKDDNIAAIKHIDEICQIVLSSDSIRYTNHCSMDALINSKYTKMKEAEIDFSCHSYLSGYDGIDILDLCVILGNILDNAIEACSKVKTKRSIKLELSQHANYISICMENNCPNELKIIGNEIVTTKSEKHLHGFGLKSIKEIANKYNGYFEVFSTDSVFTTVIMLDKATS